MEARFDSNYCTVHNPEVVGSNPTLATTPLRFFPAANFLSQTGMSFILACRNTARDYSASGPNLAARMASRRKDFGVPCEC